jgi:hypothetical protein
LLALQQALRHASTSTAATALNPSHWVPFMLIEKLPAAAAKKRSGQVNEAHGFALGCISSKQQQHDLGLQLILWCRLVLGIYHHTI